MVRRLRHYGNRLSWNLYFKLYLICLKIYVEAISTLFLITITIIYWIHLLSIFLRIQLTCLWWIRYQTCSIQMPTTSILGIGFSLNFNNWNTTHTLWIWNNSDFCVSIKIIHCIYISVYFIALFVFTIFTIYFKNRNLLSMIVSSIFTRLLIKCR